MFPNVPSLVLVLEEAGLDADAVGFPSPEQITASRAATNLTIRSRFPSVRRCAQRSSSPMK